MDVSVPLVAKVEAGLAPIIGALLDSQCVDDLPPQRVEEAHALFRLMIEQRGKRLSSLVEGSSQRRISSYRLVTTERCNLRCSYCFLPKYTGKMTSEVLFKALARMLELSAGAPIEEVQFFGGEPLGDFQTMKAAVEYLEKHRSQFDIEKISYTTTTNGTFCDLGILDFLHQYGFAVDISIDGPEILNDSLRGKGVFAKAIETYCQMRLAGINAGFIITPTLANFESLPTFLLGLIKDFSPLSITINSPQPTKLGWELPGERFAEVILDCIDVCKKEGVPLTSPADRQIAAFRHMRPYTNACTRFSDTYGVLIDTDGKFRICDVDWSLPQFVVPDDALGDLKALTNLKISSAEPNDKCKRCMAYAGCGGPCPLEKALNAFDHLTNVNRCEFNQTVAAKSLAHLVGPDA